MRTISAALEAACANGNGEPYATFAPSGLSATFDITEYTLRRDSFTCKLDLNIQQYLTDANYDNPTYIFSLVRGIRNVGTIELKGHIHSMSFGHKYTLIEGVPYGSKISLGSITTGTNTFAQIATAITLVDVLSTPTPVWYDYQFYEAGTSALTGVLNDLTSVLNLKYRVKGFPRGTNGHIGFGGGATDTLTADWDMKEIMRLDDDDAVTDDPTLKTTRIPGQAGTPAWVTMPQFNYVWYKDGSLKRTYVNSTELPYWHLGYINSETLPGVLQTKSNRLECEWTQRPNLAVEMGDIAWGTRSWNGTKFSFHRYVNGYIEFEETYKRKDGIWQTHYRITQ